MDSTTGLVYVICKNDFPEEAWTDKRKAEDRLQTLKNEEEDKRAEHERRRNTRTPIWWHMKTVELKG